MKNYALERQRLSADITSYRSIIDLKQREGIKRFFSFNFLQLKILACRRIIDTKNRLETIYAKQRDLNHEAAIVLQDQRAAELMNKIAVCFCF